MPAETELTCVSPLLVMDLTSRTKLNVFEQKLSLDSVLQDLLLVVGTKPGLAGVGAVL
jgi:hypothetical protein